MFILKRTYLEEVTHGELLFENQHIAFTIELPWLNNEKLISCIPEGEYNLRRRYSTKFKWHWIVENVPNRSHILIHPANDALLELSGCIAPVSKISGKGRGEASKKAMQIVMEMFSKHKVNGQIKLVIIGETHPKNK